MNHCSVSKEPYISKVMPAQPMVFFWELIILHVTGSGITMPCIYTCLKILSVELTNQYMYTNQWSDSYDEEVMKCSNDPPISQCMEQNQTLLGSAPSFQCNSKHWPCPGWNLLGSYTQRKTKNMCKIIY